MVNEDFSRWAIGYSGFIGGNPGGSTWLCGIEDAGGETDDNLKFDDASKPGAWDRGGFAFLAESPFNRRAAKLLMALKGRSDFDNAECFLDKERCLGAESDYFKLNLYPLAFANDSHEQWMHWHTKRTGLDNKQAYWQWCSERRFPVFRKWVQEFLPKLIICTGVGEQESFFRAFTAGELTKTCTAGNKPITYARTNEGRTLVAVTYFLGSPHGLNRDTAILETGEKLAALSREHSCQMK